MIRRAFILNSNTAEKHRSQFLNKTDIL